MLDWDRVVRYRGRVDDQFGLGVHRPSATKHELTDALESLLAGRSVATTRTEPAGCKIGRTAKPAADAKITYSKHVARILRDRCIACHREGEIAPVLAEFVQAGRGLGEHDRRGGRRAVACRPWHASPEFGKFSNERPPEQPRKSKRSPPGLPRALQRETLRDLPEPAKYVEGWRIPAPDLRISLPRTVKIPAEGTMPYENFLVDPKLKEDVWVRASQVRPGNPSVVHHLVVFVIPPGSRENEGKIDFLAAYAPGMPPASCPTEPPSSFRPARS